MTPRENLLGLYRRQGYRWAPVELPLCPTLWERFKKVAKGRSLEEYFDYPEGFAFCYVPDLKLKEREPIDWQKYYSHPLPPGTTFSIFGVAHEPGSEAAYHMRRMHHPMAAFTSVEAMRTYPFPEFDPDPTHIREAVKQIHQEGRAAIAGMACTIWETAWYIRGMPQLMMDMTEENECAIFLLDKITQIACMKAQTFAQAGVDILHLGDDIGMQKTIMMSLGMYQTWLKPRLKQVIDAAKQANPNILIFYHSCGYIEPFIPDLIEVGIQILNPIQPECMDFVKIHAEYGEVLSFNGTLGTQSVMPKGTPEEVRQTVWKNLDIAGTHGGLVCCPTHLLEPDVPWENVEAYVKACKEYRID